MTRQMLSSKLHRARVTARSVDYEGSISISRDLMEAVGIVPYEQVHVYDISNGARFVTYAIEAGGAGEVCVNGAAARLVEVGDRVIVAAYALVEERELEGFRPLVAVLNERNEIVKGP